MSGRKSLLQGAVLMLVAAGSQAQTQSGPNIEGLWQGERDYVYKMKRPDGKPIPFQPWAEKIALKSREESREGKPPPNNNQKCLPPGFVRQLQANFPFHIIQTPQQITFLWEENTRVNLVYMNQEAPTSTHPSWFGYSKGHWEGETLVIENSATNGKTPFIVDFGTEVIEIPHTEALKVTHRFRLINGGTQLEDRMTIEDSKAYTRPWEVLSVFRRVLPPDRMREYVCAENNLDLVKE